MSWNEYVFCVPESFSRLKKLNLSGCEQIASLPKNVGKVDIPMLFGLLDLDPIIAGFPVRALDSESSSSLLWLKHTNPDVLSICDLENVKSVEEARSIRLMEKQRIEALSLHWSEGVSSVEHMELLTELVPPSSVESFMLTDYEGVILPHWFMRISKYLPNLVSLDMLRCQCRSLTTLAQLPNLRKVVLDEMQNLEEFNTVCSMGEDGANELTLAKLEYLEISNCPNLRFKPYPPGALSWSISDCDYVLSSWGDFASSSAASSSSFPVSELSVESKLPLHQWRLLHHLPGLTSLIISRCNDLTISPQIIRAFTSLKSLSLQYLSLKKLPEWFGELTSLQRLYLKDMLSLEELHVNMRQLTQLQSLSLYECHALTSLPQWSGEVILLKTLKIDFCEGITSLPESILTNLQELKISNCPKLYEWCQLEENRMKLDHIMEKVLPRPPVWVYKEGITPSAPGSEETIKWFNVTDDTNELVASTNGCNVTEDIDELLASINGVDYDYDYDDGLLQSIVKQSCNTT